MATYQLTNLDARLTYVAIAYHLDRPGSELDRQRQGPAEHRLAEVAQSLEGKLDGDVATIDLNEDQRQRLLNAMSGTINELKAYPLMPSRGERQHVTASGFHEALGRLFPAVRDDPEEAVQLAAHVLALRRRIEAAG